jgi:hypothetical protein
VAAVAAIDAFMAHEWRRAGAHEAAEWADR